MIYYLFFVDGYRDHRDLHVLTHSFPTRRSSDLALRTVNTDQDLAFFKATWQITDDDRLTGTFFNDPYSRDGSLDPTVINNRDTEDRPDRKSTRLNSSH